MRRLLLVCLALAVCLSMTVIAFSAADREAIQSNVDQVVAGLNQGNPVEQYQAEATKTPNYVFIMEEDGNMLVHPTLAGQSLKDSAEPVYNELGKATPEGTWVDYEWEGKQKHTYVRETNEGLIVGSGYSE